MKVLLAGMNYLPNQFSRAIEKYGCECIHTSGDPGDFPINCDIAVIAKGHISHAKHTAVKDGYKNLGKPFLIASNGFSEIKERFEELLAMKDLKSATSTSFGTRSPPPRSDTAIAEAFKRASRMKSFASAVEAIVDDKEAVTKYVEASHAELISPIEKEDPVAKKKPQSRLAEEKRAEVKKIVRECLESEMDYQDTLEMLAAHGLARADGKPFKIGDIGNYRTQVSKEIAAEKKSPKKHAAPAKVPDAVGKQMEMISKVMESKMIGAEYKLKLIGQIQRGEVFPLETITAVKVGDALEIRSAHLFKGETTILKLSLVQAISLSSLGIMPDIQKFVNSYLTKQGDK